MELNQDDLELNSFSSHDIPRTIKSELIPAILETGLVGPFELFALAVSFGRILDAQGTLGCWTLFMDRISDMAHGGRHSDRGREIKARIVPIIDRCTESLKADIGLLIAARKVEA